MSKNQTYQLEDHVQNTQFSSLIKPVRNLQYLPLTFKREWFYLEDIINTGVFSPIPCDVFYYEDSSGEKQWENLNYMFYGRNDFKAKNPGGNPLFYPFCFVFDLSSITADVAFPFDTGGYANNLYCKQIPTGYDINNYGFAPVPDLITGLISMVYGTNENYLRSKPQLDPDTAIYPAFFAGLLYLYQNQTSRKYDERANCIEIISRASIKIKTALRAIILPREAHNRLKNNNQYVALINNGVEIYIYDVSTNAWGDECNKAIKDNLVRFYLKHGILKSVDMFTE